MCGLILRDDYTQVGRGGGGGVAGREASGPVPWTLDLCSLHAGHPPTAESLMTAKECDCPLLLLLPPPPGCGPCVADRAGLAVHDEVHLAGDPAGRAAGTVVQLLRGRLQLCAWPKNCTAA